MALFFRKKKNKTTAPAVPQSGGSSPLAGAAKSLSPREQRAMLIASLSEPERAALILQTGDAGLRKEVLETITDQVVLFELVRAAQDRNLRFDAARRINDPDLLTRILLDIPVNGARILLEKMNDAPDHISRWEKIRTGSKDQGVRLSALDRLATETGDPALWLEYARATHYQGIVTHIKDMDFVDRMLPQEQDPYVRKELINHFCGKLPNDTLLAVSLREDISHEEREYALSVLLANGFPASDPRLDHAIAAVLPKSGMLALRLGGLGDVRAVPRLEELSAVHGYKMTAPTALSNIAAPESVAALTRIMEKDPVAGEYAAKSLMHLYREAQDPAVKSALSLVSRKTYHEHSDLGDHGRSCHTDTGPVIFDPQD